MALGTISGVTKDWSDKEIKSAGSAGLKFTSTAPKISTPVVKTNTFKDPIGLNVVNSMPKVTTPTPTPTPSVFSAPKTSSTKTFNDPIGLSVIDTLNKVSPVKVNNNTVNTSNLNNTGVFAPPYNTGYTPIARDTPDIIQPQDEQFNFQTFSKFMDEYNKSKINTPLKEYKPYEMDPQVMQTLKILQDRISNPFKYDPNNDPALRQAQDQAIQLTRQDMARRGRVFDDYAREKEQESAQQLIPQYQQLGVNQYNQQTQDMSNVMNTLRNIDQTGYNRYNDTYDYGAKTEQTQYDRTSKEEQTDYNRGIDKFNQGIQSAPFTGQLNNKNTVQQDAVIRSNKLADDLLVKEQADAQELKLQKQEVADFGVTLSPEARQLRQAYLQIPSETMSKLQTLSNQDGGFATTINKLMQTDPTNPIIDQLQAMRLNKILSDPQLRAQYGAEYGMQSGAVTKIAKDEAIADVKNVLAIQKDKMSILKEEALTIKEYKEMDKITKQIDEITSNIENKKADTVLKQLESTKLELENLYLPQEKKLELNKLIAEIQGVVAKTDLTKEQIDTEIYDQGRIAAATVGEYADASAATARAGESYANTLTENATRGATVANINARTKLTNAQIEKANNEVNEKSKTNPMLKMVKDNFAKDEYDWIGDKTSKTGRKIIDAKDKERLAGILYDEYNNIKNPTTTGSSQVKNIEEVITIYGLEDAYKKQLGFQGPLNNK